MLKPKQHHSELSKQEWKPIWKIKYPNLSQKDAYKKLFPKLSKYFGKSIIVIPNKYIMYKIFGKFMITENSNDGEFTVKSSDKKSYITFDSRNIAKIQKKKGKIYFMLNLVG